MKGHLLLCSVWVTAPRQELRDFHDASPGMATSTSEYEEQCTDRTGEA